MRIALLTFCLLLSACSSNDHGSASVNQGVDPGAAQAYCLKKGLRPGTYNYESCYRNRPETQAYARSSRLSNMGIILKNRSVYSSYRGRSYPVE